MTVLNRVSNCLGFTFSTSRAGCAAARGVTTKKGVQVGFFNRHGVRLLLGKPPIEGTGFFPTSITPVQVVITSGLQVGFWAPFKDTRNF